MVKTVTDKPGQIGSGSEANKFSHIHGVTTKPGQRNTDTTKYTGVRKRKWGKWVSEIRLPNSRERIWLGSYSSARRAARAFDAALFCLRGPTAKFNFPDNPPEIPGGRSLVPSQIQSAAAQFANSEPQIENSDPSTSSSSGTDELHLVDSPSNSVSDGAIHFNNDFALDTSFLDEFETMGTSSGNNSVPDFGIFPGFDDFATDFFMSPPLPNAVDYNEVEETYDDYTSQGSFLWNF